MPQGSQWYTRRPLSPAELLAFCSLSSFSSCYLLPFPLPGCPPSSLFLIFHPSVCLHVWLSVFLSVWTFLTDIWGRHKAEEMPNDALGLTLISQATRMSLSLFLSVDCLLLELRSKGLADCSHSWPIQNFIKNDCSPMLVQYENSWVVSLRNNVGVQTAAVIKTLQLSWLLIG